MDNATKELLLQNLDEYILDEEKIVTCRWFSKALDINIADSKDILSCWVDKRRKDHPDTNLIITYLVTGTKKDGGALVTVVRETDLESVLETLEPNASQHIYSVQKGKSFDNLILLGIIEPSFKTSSDAIRCPESAIKVRPSRTIPAEPEAKVAAVKQAPAPVEKKNNLFTKQVEKKTIVEESTSVQKDDQKSETIKNNPKKSSPVDKKTDKGKAAAKPVAKGGIANFFNRPNGISTQKVTVKTETKETSPPQKVNQLFQTPDKTKESSSKSDKENNEKSSPIAETKKTVQSEDIEIKKEVSDDVDDEDIVPNTPQEDKAKKAKKNRKPPAKKRERESSSEKKNVKRRKRIVAQSDSSDDDMFAGSDSEKAELKPKEIFRRSPSPPPREPSPPPSLKKRQKKKFVDRTYTDEDGYIITSKEQIECSASEEDEPVEKKPVIEKPAEKQKVIAKKPASTSNVKQSNLMSFFKKK